MADADMDQDSVREGPSDFDIGFDEEWIDRELRHGDALAAAPWPVRLPRLGHGSSPLGSAPASPGPTPFREAPIPPVDKLILPSARESESLPGRKQTVRFLPRGESGQSVFFRSEVGMSGACRRSRRTG